MHSLWTLFSPSVTFFFSKMSIGSKTETSEIKIRFVEHAVIGWGNVRPCLISGVNSKSTGTQAKSLRVINMAVNTAQKSTISQVSYKPVFTWENLLLFTQHDSTSEDALPTWNYGWLAMASSYQPSLRRGQGWIQCRSRLKALDTVLYLIIMFQAWFHSFKAFSKKSQYAFDKCDFGMLSRIQRVWLGSIWPENI